MRKLLLLLLLVSPKDDLDKGMKTIKAGDIQKHQVYLASDELEGRDSGSDGGHKAAIYITEHLAKCGFRPGASDGGWFQPFGGGGSYGPVDEANYLHFAKDSSWSKYEVYKFNEHVVPFKGSHCGAPKGSVVFAGYGITAAEFEYDDYRGLKVKDAIVLVLDHEPQEKDATSRWNGDKPTKYSDWSHKIEAAVKAGAAALLIVIDPANHPDEKIPKHEEIAWPGDKEPKYGIPVVYVSPELGQALAKAAGKDLKAVQAEIDKDAKPRNFRVPRPAKLSVSMKGYPGKGTKNIVAVWPGTDEKLKDEVVVLGAHYDHVGYGRQGSNGGSGKIHNGADDNGSGTSTLLDVAEAFKEVKLKRTVVLLWFDAEEKGLVGSKAWCDSPTVPAASIVFMINLDMVGRNDIKKILVGVEKDPQKTPKYPKVVTLLNEAERRFGIAFDMSGADDLIQRSDHWSFMQKGVPAVFFTGGLHGDYHTDRDDVEKINFPKEELIGKIAFFLAHKMANAPGTLK